MHCATGDDNDDDDDDDDNDGNDDDNDLARWIYSVRKWEWWWVIDYFGQCILLVLSSLECLSIFILAGCILLEFT